MLRKLMSLFLAVIFTGQCIFGFGSTAMAASTYITSAIAPVFYPVLAGLQLNQENPFELSFIVDLADKTHISEDETKKLIRYFLATLTIPEDELWVNLSPYEKDRILPESLSVTDAGKDLLMQDYFLKRITASMTDPESPIGKKFWNEIRQKVYDKYGTAEIPYNVFNKVWIVPESAVIYVIDNTAYISESHLKVMLEDDYQARKALDSSSLQTSDVDQLSSQIAREVLIPEIEKAVNESETFAPLRQVFYSQILAYWFKKNLKENIISQIYAGKNKLKGVDLQNPDVKEEIYAKYLDAFKKGAYDKLREEYDPATEQVVEHKIYSGGYVGKGLTEDWIKTEKISSRSVLAQKLRRVKNTMLVTIALLAAGLSTDVLAQISDQKILSYSGIEHSRVITSDDSDEMDLLEAYITKDDILSLNGKKTSIQGREDVVYVIDVSYFSNDNNYQKIFVSHRYGWRFETAVIAAQEKLRAHGSNIAVDGDFGPETIAALRQVLGSKVTSSGKSSSIVFSDQKIEKKSSVNSQPSVSTVQNKKTDLSQQKTGLEAGSQQISSQQLGSNAKENPSFISSDIQALNHKIDSLMDQITLMQNHLKSLDSTVVGAGSGGGGGEGGGDDKDSTLQNTDSLKSIPAIISSLATTQDSILPDSASQEIFTVSIWNDTWYATKGPGQYGWYSVTYNADKFSASVSGETAGWRDPELGFQGTISPYLGLQYKAGPSFILSGGIRLATQRVNGVTFGKMAYSIDKKFWQGAGITYARAYIPSDDPEDVSGIFKEAILLSTDFKIGHLSLSPGVFIAGQELEWNTFWNFGISDRVKIFGEKNLTASTAVYGPMPNDIARLGANIGLGKPDDEGNYKSYILPYLTANNFKTNDFPNTNIGGGVVFSWAPVITPKKKVPSPLATDKSVDNNVGGIGPSENVGGVDLSLDDKTVKIKSSNKVPVNAQPVIPFNFDLQKFQGFDFRIIQMIPLYHLGKYIEKSLNPSAIKVSYLASDVWGLKE